MGTYQNIFDFARNALDMRECVTSETFKVCLNTLNELNIYLDCTVTNSFDYDLVEPTIIYLEAKKYYHL